MKPLSLLVLLVLVSSGLLELRVKAGEGEVRGLLLCAGGGRVFTGEEWAELGRMMDGWDAGETSASLFVLPNLGILLNRLARRFLVVGDSWLAGF
jgi:hypothetical protein